MDNVSQVVEGGTDICAFYGILGICFSRPLAKYCPITITTVDGSNPAPLPTIMSLYDDKKHADNKRGSLSGVVRLVTSRYDPP